MSQWHASVNESSSSASSSSSSQSSIPSLVIHPRDVSLAIAVPSFNDRSLTPEQAIARRRKQTERRRELRKRRRSEIQATLKEQDELISKSSSSLTSSSLPSSAEKENIDPNDNRLDRDQILSAADPDSSACIANSSSSASSSSAEEVPLLPRPINLSADCIMPIGALDGDFDKLKIWRRATQSSIPTSILRNVLQNTVAFAHGALLKALKEESGVPLPLVGGLNDYAVQIVFGFSIERSQARWNASAMPTKLLAIANLIAMLLYFAGVFGCRCGCKGQKNNTDHADSHANVREHGRCTWIPRIYGDWRHLTVDHQPGKKRKEHSSIGLRVASVVSNIIITAEIVSWRWSYGSSDNGPFKCSNCNPRGKAD